MRVSRNTWAVVLAAGDGTRLATLTTDQAGNAVPKQFCSLDGGRSLLQEAVLRAGRVVRADRLCVMVAEQHRRYWCAMRCDVRDENIIVQPANRGTAHGILLAVLSILTRDPHARIVFLPADHHVRDESALASAVRSAATQVSRNSRVLALVGIEPDEPDPELGYVVPGRMLADGVYTVRCFVEKPRPELASELLAAGAVWNSFIFAADGPSLLRLLRRAMAVSVDAMAAALARQRSEHALEDLYEALPSLDFSRAVVQGAEELLSVVAAPACGWSDLGTPKRVAETLRRIDRRTVRADPQAGLASGFAHAPALINLAIQHARLGLANWRTTP
jgi:mannose-1-phosphate guanylyltransferase